MTSFCNFASDKSKYFWQNITNKSFDRFRSVKRFEQERKLLVKIILLINVLGLIGVRHSIWVILKTDKTNYSSKKGNSRQVMPCSDSVQCHVIFEIVLVPHVKLHQATF